MSGQDPSADNPSTISATALSDTGYSKRSRMILSWITSISDAGGVESNPKHIIRPINANAGSRKFFMRLIFCVPLFGFRCPKISRGPYQPTSHSKLPPRPNWSERHFGHDPESPYRSSITHNLRDLEICPVVARSYTIRPLHR